MVWALPLAMAAVALFVGFWHWRVWARGSREREQLLFALLCLGVGLYDISASGSYAGQGAAAAALWQRLQNLALGLVAPALCWFVLAYTRQRTSRVAWVLTAYYLFHVVVLLTAWNDWAFAPIQHVTTVRLPFGMHVVYHELRHGPLLRLSSVAHAATIVATLSWTVGYLRRAGGEERPRARRLALGMAVFLLGGLNDIAVTNALYSFVYLLEYAYFAVVLVMTAGLSSAVLDLARARGELRQSMARLKRIFESVEEVYIETTLDGTILEVSSSASRYVGKGVDLRGRSSLEFYARPEQREQILATLLRDGRVRDFENTTLLPDGSEVTAASNLALVVDEATGEKRIVGSIRDITEQKRAQAERQRLEQQMQQAQKLESLGLLAGGIAHDFNNLLTGVLGSSELALLQLAPEHPARARVAAIQPLARRAADLCRELLAYSGRSRFEVAPLELSALVRQMDEVLRLSCGKAVAIEYALAEGLPAVVGDATQLQQILMNLVINASEAMNGKGVVTVRTRLVSCGASELQSVYVRDAPARGEYLALEVQDAGCGMSEATRLRLFDPFFTTKFSGRGLGLAAALGIVRAHHGTIQVASEVGRGSTFRVLLPVAAASSVVRERPAEPPNGWTGTGRALLVDDEPAVREVGRDMLEFLGFEVDSADGGRAAIELFKSAAAPYSFAIVDLTMPDLGGVEVALELLRIRPGTPLLLASGYSEEEGEGLLARAGASGFLAKPFSLEVLRQRIRAVLDHEQPALARPGPERGRRAGQPDPPERHWRSTS